MRKYASLKMNVICLLSEMQPKIDSVALIHMGITVFSLVVSILSYLHMYTFEQICDFILNY